MRLNDVANQLRILLPNYTDRFSTNLAVTSITVAAGVSTFVTSAPHGLTTGRSVILSGIGRKTPIDSVANDGFIFTFETSIDHDQTMNWYANPAQKETSGKIVLGGFTNPLWNASFDLTGVPNRRNVKLRSSVAAPTLNGAEYILEVEAGRMSGPFQVTVVNTTTFTVSGSFTTGQYFGGKVSTMPRVAVAVTGQDAWERILSPQAPTDWAIYVCPEVVSVSKDRTELSDAVAAKTQGADFRLRVLDGFNVMIVAQTGPELGGGAAIDVCRDELRPVIYRCLAGAMFDSGMATAGQFKAIPTGDAVASYDRSKLVYTYEFQVPYDITLDDGVPPAHTSAFRDISYELEEGDGMNAPINLDDEPLN